MFYVGMKQDPPPPPPPPSADIFQSLLFQNIILGTLLECQPVLDPDQDRHDLHPNCLHRLSALSRQQTMSLVDIEFNSMS